MNEVESIARRVPRVKKDGGSWIVLRLGAHGWENDWTYNRCFNSWHEAIDNALTTTNGFVKIGGQP